MSHFTKVKTKLVDLDFVKKAAASLGYSTRDGKIRGWQGQKRDAELVIEIPGAPHDVGLRRLPDGTFSLMADWYGMPVSEQEFLHKIHQQYAYHVVLEKLESTGFRVESNTTEGQAIRLVLRRSN